MTWWQILLVFVGIPAAVFVVITALGLAFASAPVPDGLARAAEAADEDGRPRPEPAAQETGVVEPGETEAQ